MNNEIKINYSIYILMKRVQNRSISCYKSSMNEITISKFPIT